MLAAEYPGSLDLPSESSSISFGTRTFAAYEAPAACSGFTVADMLGPGQASETMRALAHTEPTLRGNLKIQKILLTKSITTQPISTMHAKLETQDRSSHCFGAGDHDRIWAPASR